MACPIYCPISCFPAYNIIFLAFNTAFPKPIGPHTPPLSIGAMATFKSTPSSFFTIDESTPVTSDCVGLPMKV
jgi:hypothetical protein